jgi:hypothetical protein
LLLDDNQSETQPEAEHHQNDDPDAIVHASYKVPGTRAFGKRPNAHLQPRRIADFTASWRFGGGEYNSPSSFILTLIYEGRLIGLQERMGVFLPDSEGLAWSKWSATTAFFPRRHRTLIVSV